MARVNTFLRTHLDGFEATRHIREFERENKLATTPVFAAADRVIGNFPEKIEASGMQGRLGKPIVLDELIDVLDEIVGRKHEGPFCPEGAQLVKPDSATGSVSRPSRPWRSRWAEFRRLGLTTRGLCMSDR